MKVVLVFLAPVGCPSIDWRKSKIFKTFLFCHSYLRIAYFRVNVILNLQEIDSPSVPVFVGAETVKYLIEFLEDLPILQNYETKGSNGHWNTISLSRMSPYRFEFESNMGNNILQRNDSVPLNFFDFMIWMFKNALQAIFHCSSII